MTPREELPAPRESEKLPILPFEGARRTPRMTPQDNMEAAFRRQEVKEKEQEARLRASEQAIEERIRSVIPFSQERDAS